MEQTPPKVFKKLVESNQAISFAVNTLITEYDIQRCHPSCMYFIKGPEFYKELMAMPKLDSNVKIGKMMRDDPTLAHKIGEIKLRFFNEFCKVNNIKESNFLSSTVDSLLLVNKKPLKTKFENGVINFRNKYINSKDTLMWASLLDGNKYVYIIDGEKVLSDEYLPETNQNILVKTDNFQTFILPLIKLCFKPH